MSFNNKSGTSLDDLHSDSRHFEESYSDAAQSQAREDFIKSEGTPVGEPDNTEIRVKQSYWNNVSDSSIEEDDGMDDKWSQFKAV